MSSSGMDRNVHSVMVFIQHFQWPTTASPTLQDVLKDVFLERLSWRMIRPNHANFRLLTVARRTHNGVDFAPHPVVGLLLQAGDEEKFPQAPDNDGKGRQKRLIKNVGKVSPVCEFY